MESVPETAYTLNLDVKYFDYVSPIFRTEKIECDIQIWYTTRLNNGQTRSSK